MPDPIDLEQFATAAQKSGKIHLSSDNKVSSSSQGLLRRLRGASSEEKEQNKAVRQALLKSLKAAYGEGFGKAAASMLDGNSPRSLDAKTVQELIKQGKVHLGINENANRMILETFQRDLRGMLNSKAAAMGIEQPLSGLNLLQMQADLKTAVEQAADGNRRILTGPEAEELAAQVVEKAIGQKMGLDVGQQQQDLQANAQSFPPLKKPPPSVLPPLPGEQPQANAQSSPPLKTPPPSVLPPLPGEQPATLQRSPSVRDDLSKKGAVSNNPFKIQDEAMKAGKATRNALPASNKPAAPAKGSSIKNG